MKKILCFLVVSSLLIFSGLAFGPPLEKLSGMQARSIGPAGMSGRISEIEVDSRDSNTIYIGAAAGGVWKSTNGAITWTPIFDDQPVASIGAIAIAPSNSDVVWVGTGEGNPRNSVSVGNGVYRSIDGGRNWKHLGLDGSEKIHRILVHPRNPDVAYVAALGPTWNGSSERGVFKTSNGGEDWAKVLYVNSTTGAADLVMDPQNPEKLIAAMWEHKRWPWFFESGGPGSGIYVTFDGGRNWTRRGVEDGLPEGNLGRTGLAIAPSRPNVVYALVEAEKSALLRSDDGGFSFAVINDSANVNPRPFYYADIYVDPSNENRLYSLHGSLNRSEDAGRTSTSLVESARIHGDYQGLWIDPADSDHLLASNDGGLALTRDGGKTWRFIENLPLAQFYHVNVDMETPYNVYGGLQDNGSWRGPSSIWKQRGIYNWYWDRVGSGDGFDTMADPGEPGRYGYSMSQRGNLRRFDLETGERKIIKPVHPDGEHLRFNWNTALAQDPNDPGTIYLGSQFLHKSSTRGSSWEIISPDLTTNESEYQQQADSGGLTRDSSGAENFTTIVTIAPSPLEAGVIWVGTDDGNIQLTRDGGRTWNNTRGNMTGVPDITWVPHIEASVHKRGEAFAVLEDHRRGNWDAYVFKTEDYGQSWTNLATSDLSGYALVIEQDPVEPDLLFLGTEFGLWVSFDAGQSWSKWTHGVPTSSVMDMAIHPRDHDLVLATHGRAVFVLDDIRPLRQLAKTGLSSLDQPLVFFEPGPAIQYVEGEAGGLRGPGDAVFQGENRPYGALLSYIWNPAEGSEESGQRAKLEVLDATNRVIRSLSLTPEPGLNRTTWGLKRAGVRGAGRQGRRGGAQSGEPAGFPVRPGTYGLRITAGQHTATRQVQVLTDPRRSIPSSDMDLMETHLERVYALQRTGGAIESRLAAMEKGLAAIRGQAGEATAALTELSDSLSEGLRRLRQTFSGGPPGQGRRDPSTLQSKLGAAMSAIGDAWIRPTQEQGWLADQAESALADFRSQLNQVISVLWPRFREAVEEARITPLEAVVPLPDN